MDEKANPLDVPKKPKRLSKRGRKAFRLTRFDKDVARLIQSNVFSLQDFCARLGVDLQAAEARLNVLVEKGLLVCESGRYRLGVEGYNKFTPRLKLAADQKPSADKDQVDLSVIFSPVEARKRPQSGAPVTSIPTERSVDLGELLRKGAPNLPEVKEKDACELCRAEFKVSVKNPSAAKFAHCVCGAAYHKDCYSATLEGGSRCARCGRKLSVVLDKSSEDAIKGIKDVFE